MFKVAWNYVEDFITQVRTYRFIIMCSLVAHDKIQPDYEDYESSI